MKRKNESSGHLFPYAVALLFLGALGWIGMMIWVFTRPEDTIPYAEKMFIVVFILACGGKALLDAAVRRTLLSEATADRTSLAVIGGFAFAAVVVKDTFGDDGTLLKFSAAFVCAALGLSIVDAAYMRLKARWQASRVPPSQT